MAKLTHKYTMRHGCLGIARTVALVAVLAGCALPCGAMGSSRPIGATDGLWGVNYYAPFALDYNELTRRGVDPKAAIRDDVTHFRRLGIDLLRIHCFDRQISRRDGSLADTVHLELLDYLVSVAASNGMRTVLTPIAWYGWSPMDGRAGLVYWRHVLARVAVLWVLGMVAQGRLLSLDILRINPFNNTLQAIAAGYLVAAAVLAVPSRHFRRAAPFVLALGYTAILHFCGDYTMPSTPVMPPSIRSWRPI